MGMNILEFLSKVANIKMTNVEALLWLCKLLLEIQMYHKDNSNAPNFVRALSMAIDGLSFKDYFDGLYGQGLEVANWHLNGEMESFDNLYEDAVAGGKTSASENG